MATQKTKADLKSNPGIPGIVNRQEPNYLQNVQRLAQAELQRRNINQRALERIGQLISDAQRAQAGHEELLQRLAEQIIRSNYGSILDGVGLNLKLVPFGAVTGNTPRFNDVLAEPPTVEQQQQKAEMAQQNQDRRVQNQPVHMNQQPTQTLLDDESLILEVHKRKIINNIIQGEGKNTHRLIHMEEVRNELNTINPTLFSAYDEVLKIAEFLDWIIPMEEKLYMMKNMTEGFGGFNTVDWYRPGQQGPDRPQVNERQNPFAQPQNPFQRPNNPFQEPPHPQNPFQNPGTPVQGRLQNDNIDFGDIDPNRTGKDPVITAVGVDFPMLIHETVKGIYELIGSGAIPTDAFIAETVMMNTDTLQDEIEDLRYGPFIAADFRNFVNINPLSNHIPNLREHVFGKIIQLQANEFLALIKSILLQTPQARTYIDGLCEEIAAEVRQQERDINFGAGNYTDVVSETEEDENVLTETEPEAILQPQEDEVDFSKMSTKDLAKMMDKALDEGDFDLVAKIREHLK